MEIIDFGDFQPKSEKESEEKPVIQETEKEEKLVIRETKTRNSRTPAWQKKINELETKFEEFQLAIETQLATLQLTDMPESVRDALTIILKETHKRYKKWNYTGYLGHAKTLIKFFKINLK